MTGATEDVGDVAVAKEKSMSSGVPGFLEKTAILVDDVIDDVKRLDLL